MTIMNSGNKIIRACADHMALNQSNFNKMEISTYNLTMSGKGVAQQNVGKWKTTSLFQNWEEDLNPVQSKSDLGSQSLNWAWHSSVPACSLSLSFTLTYHFSVNNSWSHQKFSLFINNKCREVCYPVFTTFHLNSIAKQDWNKPIGHGKLRWIGNILVLWKN